MPYHNHGAVSRKNTRPITITKRDIERKMGNVKMHTQFVGTVVDVTIGLVAGALYGVISTAIGRYKGISIGSIVDHLGEKKRKQLTKIIKRMQKKQITKFEAIGHYQYRGKNKGYVLTGISLK